MKKQTKFRFLYPLVIFSILIFSSCSQKQNWPQFRGQEGNMIVAGSNLPEEWGNDKNIKWTYKMEGGPGNGSPLLYKGLLYIIGGREEISCLNAVTGKQVYKTRLTGAGAIWSSPWAYNDKI
jgi:hypothetical protein